MNQPSRDQLILLHSLLELNESATADTIWANIQFHNTLQAAMPSADFNQALDALLSAGILVRPSARGDLLEFEYAAYEHFLHLCATGPQDNISAAGQRRIEEAASFVRMFLSGEGEEIAQEVRDRQTAEKRALELHIEKEKAQLHGTPYDILLAARETRRGKHKVYVILLDDRVRDKRGVRLGSKPTWPAVYVGLTSLSPQKRFNNHKTNRKAGRGYVRDHGLRLLPDLYEAYNPMPYDLAVTAEAALAEKLRLEGYTVLGGH